MKKASLVLTGIVVLLLCYWFGQRLFVSPPLTSDSLVATSTFTTLPSKKDPIPSSVAFTTSSLRAVPIKLASGKNFALSIPHEYSLTVAADGLRKPRFMALSPDNRLVVGEMYSASDTTKGRVLILSDYDAAKKRYTKTTTYLDNLRNPNSVAFYQDSVGKAWLYIALTDRLVRYAYVNGDLAPRGEAQIIARFPDSGRGWADGGWHLTRTVLPVGEKLYVSVGSSCNSCEEKADEPSRAAILRMNPDGSGVEVFANGLRNAVGLVLFRDQLFATNNGPDHLGSDRPDDMFYQIQANTNYGWPSCYEYAGRIEPDSTQVWQYPVDCASVPQAYSAMPPHSAPLGVATFRDQFLIALHGSGQKALATGYEVVGVSNQSSGKPMPVITGFLQNGTVVGRPAGVLTRDENSFFVTDDLNGMIYLLEQS